LIYIEYKFFRIANRHDWIIATAASRINGRICIVINTVNNTFLIDGQLFSGSVNNKCPAIMFVVKRTASVLGRIRFADCFDDIY